MAAETHQTQTPAAATPTAAVVLPRSEEGQAPAGDPTEKAALEAKERMSKTQGFWNRLSPEKDKAEKPAQTQSDKPPRKEDKPAAAAATPETPPAGEAKDKKPKPRKREPEIDPLEIARATGQEIGREMAKASQIANVPRGTTPDTPTEVELPEEFKPDVGVFEEMARLDPKRYGNIKKELARYASAETEYIAKWEEEHPGETFDGDSNEHDGFYAKIRPSYEQNDFKAAERSLLKKEVINETAQEMRQREADSEKRRERAAQIQPEVDHTMVGTLGEMIREVDPDNAELAKDWASMQKMDEANPMLSDVMVAVHNETKPVVTAAMRLFRSVEAPDPKNPVHLRLFNLIENAEQQLSRLPIKDRYDDDGRLFATQAEYAAMSPAEQAHHWYVGEKETLALIRGQAIGQTKTIYDRKKQEFERYTKQPSATQPANRQPAKNGEAPAQNRPDNGSPSVSGRGTLPGDGQSAANKPTSGRDLFFGRHLGA